MSGWRSRPFDPAKSVRNEEERGIPFSAALASPKEHVNIRLDADIVHPFKRKGPGWQTRMNSALREWLRTRSG